MRRSPAIATVAGLLAACTRPGSNALRATPSDTADLIAPSECAVVYDRPPGDLAKWTFSGNPAADVIAGVRPAATWPGTAALLHVGPRGGCYPGCRLDGDGYGGLTVASGQAVELELGCAASAPSSDAWAGVRLRLTGPSQRLADGTTGPLDILTPLLLTTGPDGQPSCVDDSYTYPEATTQLVAESGRLEPGRVLTHRIPLGPLVEAAGMDPLTTLIGIYHVVLEVNAGKGSDAWIEVGRIMSDRCP